MTMFCSQRLLKWLRHMLSNERRRVCNNPHPCLDTNRSTWMSQLMVGDFCSLELSGGRPILIDANHSSPGARFTSETHSHPDYESTPRPPEPNEATHPKEAEETRSKGEPPYLPPLVVPNGLIITHLHQTGGTGLICNVLETTRCAQWGNQRFQTRGWSLTSTCPGMCGPIPPHQWQ